MYSLFVHCFDLIYTLKKPSLNCRLFFWVAVFSCKWLSVIKLIGNNRLIVSAQSGDSDCPTFILVSWLSKCTPLVFMSLFTHTHVFVLAVVQQCVCLFFILSTPCHLFIFHPSIHPYRTVLLGEAEARSQKYKCAPLTDESERQLHPTVCKYVVSLIERSSTSQ